MSKRAFKQLKEKVSGQFQYWKTRESDFYSQVPPNQSAVDELMSDDTEVFSVIILQKKIKNYTKVFNNPDLFKKILQITDSEIEREAWKKYNDSRQTYDDKVWERVKTECNLEKDSKEGWAKFDLFWKDQFKELGKEVYPSVFEEHASYELSDYPDKGIKKFYKNIEIIEEEDPEAAAQLLAVFFKNHPKIKKAIHKKIITRERVHTYDRKFSKQLPKNLAKILPTETSWIQVYVKKKGKKVTMVTGYGRGSGTRENQGYFGHLFATAQNQGKPIKTFIVEFNSVLTLSRITIHDKLILVNRDLTGNYPIDFVDSKAILKGTQLINP